MDKAGVRVPACEGLADKSEHAEAKTRLAYSRGAVSLETHDPIGYKALLAGAMYVQARFQYLNLVLGHIRVEKSVHSFHRGFRCPMENGEVSICRNHVRGI